MFLYRFFVGEIRSTLLVYDTVAYAKNCIRVLFFITEVTESQRRI